jgi:hypothetical protein
MTIYGKLLAWVVLLAGLPNVTLSNPVKNLKPAGEARLTVYFWKVYDATLHTTNGQYSQGQTPLTLTINYLRDIDSTDLIKQTREEWQSLNVSEDKIDVWLPKLTQIFPDIKKGDTLALHIDDQQVSHFYFNQNALGEIEDPLFGEQFVRIWLDENCSYPKTCKKLRGESD